MTSTRELLAHALERVARRQLVSLPITFWGTKGFEFWTFLSLLLLKSNCSKILELGTGRSSLTLAEYAKFRGAQLTCIEASKQWYNKVCLDFRHAGLSREAIHLISIDPRTGWYNLDQFRAATRDSADYDFVFVDGPNTSSGSSRGMRDSETGLRRIRACAVNADIVLVDDVHRRHIFDTLDRIVADTGRYASWFYGYAASRTRANTLCLMVKQDSKASRELPAITSLTGVRLEPNFPRDRCCED